MKKLFTLCFLMALVCVKGWGQVSVTATAGITGPTSYSTLNAAFTAINGGTHQGAIVINISANTTEPTTGAVLNSTGAGTASYTSVLIQPSVDGVSISGATSTGLGVITLNGADNVTINGDNPNTSGTNRNLTVANTAATTVTYNSVIRIAAYSSVITTANSNTIRNCIVTGNASSQNTSSVTSTTSIANLSYGIYAGATGTTAPASATTAPSAIGSTSTVAPSGSTITSLTVDNNLVNACARAIMVQGGGATVATGLSITNNIIGAATTGSATTVYSYGIGVNGGNGTVSGNNIRNIESYVGAALRAISIDDISSALAGDIFIIEKNIISSVISRSTGDWGAYGINVIGGTGHIIQNNFIYGLNSVFGNSAYGQTYGIRGIRIAGTAASNDKIYHNSIYLSGATLSGGGGADISACFTITATSLTGIDVRNNIFSNTMTGAYTGSVTTCMQLPSGGSSSFALTLNNNAYYSTTNAAAVNPSIASITSGSAVTATYTAATFNASATTPTTNLRAYTSTLSAAGTNDNASYASGNTPPFTSTTDLHLLTTSSEITNVEQKGATGLGVSTDIDGDTRPNSGTTNPDMGADEVVYTPPTCVAPIIGTPTSITASSASIPFTCTSCSPGNAYIIEYGASGFTPGTGATAGTGGTVVTGTASPIAISGLTGSTTYDVYVRQNCTASSNGYSANSGKTTFTTLCTAATLPFTEAFTSTTFPPSSCWAISSSSISRSTVNGYGATGTGSAKFDFFNAAAGNYDLTLPILTATPANYQLSFDEAYATYSGEVDNLVIRYSTDGGTTYTNLITYAGGASGTLNTGGTTTSMYTPSSTQWKTFTVTLPTGTTNVVFRGVSANGNNLYIDNISIAAPPACTAPTIGTPTSITGSSASIPFTCTSCSPGNAYIVEYGASGFTPGTGATAGTGGTVVTGTTSPITISGLSATTTYDVYVRQNCTSASNGYSANSAKATFTTTLRTATWVGTTSTDWNTTSNWSTNVVPVSTDLVVIATATNQPVINASNSAVAASITLNSGTTLAVNGTLADGGAWTNNSSAAAVSGTGTVTLSGTSAVIGGSASTAFPNLTITGTISQGINTTVTGNYIQTAGTYTVTPGATAYTLTVGGNFTESAGTFNVTGISATAGAVVTVTGNTSIFSILFEPNLGNTASTVVFQANGNVTMTGSSTSTSLDWMAGGTGGTTYPIAFGIKGNFNWSGTGDPFTSGDGSANGFTFNGSGTTASPQTLTYSGAASSYGLQFVISAGTVVQLQTNIAEGTSTLPYSHFIVNGGTLDAQTFVISGGTTGGGASSGFFLTSGSTLITKNTGGVSATITDAKTNFNAGANYVFNGTAAQTANFSTTTMANLTINNTAALTTTGVTNNAASTVTGILTLTAGKLTTTTTNTVSVTNTATGAVTGGSASSYISGPLNWALANSTSYLFPVGTTSAYYPYRIVTTTGNSSPVVQVSATAASAGGSANGTTLSAISTSEYWKTTTISGTFTGGSLSLGRNAALGSLNAIGSSTILAGAYASLGGTVGTLSGYNSVNNSSQTGTIAAATPLYTVLAQAASYTVTYNGNGNTSGTVPVDASSPYAYNATVTVLGNTGTLVKTGYTFSGWNTAANGSGTAYAPGATFSITTNTTLYAQYTINSYTLTYNGNTNTGGTAPSAVTQNYNTTTTVAGQGTLVKTGYTFTGWNTAADGSGTPYAAGSTFTFTANTTLYAQWTIASYTLSYDGNGNTGGTAPASVTQNYNTTIAVAGPGTLVKIGYTFTGWNTAADGSGTSYAIGSTFTFTANTTLYAQWSINSYTLSYDGNSNTGGTAPASVTQNYNTTTIVAGPSTLVKTGYTFSGWNTAADGTGTAYAAGSTFTFTANTTLYAQWTINTYTLTYDGNTNTGGTAPASVTQDYNTTISVAGQGTLVKTGYSFTGWNTAADGTGTPYAAGSTFTFTANTTLYAQWAVITYTITASAGPNGTINPGGATTVNSGDNQTYTFTPDVNYTIQQVLVDGVNDPVAVSSGTYTFTNVTADHTISVSFFLSTCPNPATANAGPDSSVCSNASYTLTGTIGGGATTATWITSGTGTFSPNATYTGSGNTTYTPSAADSAAGSVTITLTTDDPNPGVCGVAADNMVLTINPLPTATVVADNLYACAGSGGSFTITGTPNSTVFYMLSPGGSSSATLDGSGSATVTLGFISANTTITLTSVVADVTNCTSTPAGAGSTATITAAPLPVAEDLTGGGNYCSGVTGVPVGLSSSQSGVSYQLQVNDGTTTSPVGSPVAGTGSALSFGNQTIVGTYSVVATNTTTGCVRNGGGATVMVGLYTEATITTDATPTTQTVCQNGTPTDLTVTAVGNNLVYQWYRNTTSSTTGGTAVGGNSSSYTPVTTATGTLYYYVTVTGPCRTITSQIDTVTVTPSTTITGQPASASYCPNTTATALSVTASGTGTLSYQWFSNTTNITTGGTQVSTSATYTPPTTTVGTTYYYVVVSSSCGSTTSNTATVVVNAPPTVAASSNCANTFGGSVTLTATATAGSGTITGYQWNLGGTSISGATSSTYTTSNTGSYTVTVTNSNGCTATSAPVVIGMATGALTAGTYTIGGTGCNNFPTIASAVTYLNTNGITGTGGVIFNVPAGYIETAPTGGFTITATGTAANPIKFQKSGTGAVTITAFTPQASGSRVDAIFKIVGGDYITIDGFTMQENPANTVTTLASNTMTEFGVALFYASATDGAQNNTIQNNAITLSSLGYQNSIGIYSNTRHTVAAPTVTADATATSGLNIGLKVYNNTISNVAYGIEYTSALNTATVTESGVDIGGSSSPTGNTVTYGNNTVADAGWAGFSNTSSGIGYRNGATVNIRYNTVTSNAMTIVTEGIYLSAATAPASTLTYTNTISNNTVNLTENGTGTASAVIGIDFGYGSSIATFVANTNTVNIAQSVSAAATGQVWGILAGYANVLSTISGNTITITQSNTGTGANSGQVAGIGDYPAASITGSTQTASNNVITFKQNAPTSTGTYSGVVGYILSQIATNAYSVATGTISNNQFLTTGSTLRTTNAVYGVYHDYTYTTSLTMNSNTMTWDKTGSATAYGTYSTGSGFSTAINITNNTFTLTGSATSGATTVFSELDGNSSTSTVKTITGNTININVPALASTVVPVAVNYSYGSFSNNGITVSTAGSITGSTIGSSASAYTFNNNTYSLTSSLTSPTISGILIASGSGHTISNNTFTAINANATGTSAPVINAISLTSTTTTTANNIFGNKITNITTGAGSGSATVTGINIAGGVNNVYKNKVYDLSTANTGSATLIRDISATAGTTVNIYNNLIGQTNTLTGVSSADAVRGISITSATASTSYNVYYNTVYLNTSSTGATVFGTSSIYHTASATTTTGKLDLRNNIIINLSTATGGGITTAFRRSAAATLGNYATTSNNNMFYAGTPSATNTILYDGTNSYQTFASFQTAVASRETASFTGETGFTYSTPNSFFISLTGSSSDFLHVKSGITTQAESGGQTISGYADDYDGETRPNNTTSNKPDVGADEFVGVTPAPTIALNSFYVTGTTTPGTTSQCTAKGRDVSVTVTTPAGTITSVVLNYSYNGTAQTPITLTGSGGTYTGTIPAAMPANATVTWSVTATNSAGLTAIYTGASYTDAPLTGITATASASPNPVCAGSPTTLTGVFSKGGTATLGSGAITASSYDGVFYHLYGGEKTQFLVKASELSALGLTAGNITSLGIVMSTVTTQAYSGFAVNIASAPATLTSMSSGLYNGTFAQVYSAASYTPVTGTNTFTFSTPFVWDGTSNVVIQFCWSNNNTGGTSNYAKVDAPGFVSCAYYRADSQTPATLCATITGTGTTSNRPQFIFAGNVSPTFTSYSWSNGTTTVGTTNPLTVTPTATTTYTVTATDANGCTITSAPGVTVTVNPLPAAPTSTTTSNQCGLPTYSVNTSGGGTFYWYTAATGGTAVTSNTTGTYTPASYTTGVNTIYVSVNNGTCESARTRIDVTVTNPDAITALANGSATSAGTCLGGNVVLSATKVGNSNIYNYTWTSTSGSGISTSVIGNPVTVVPTATGTYTYTVTANDANTNCTTTSTVNVTVSALPTTPTITASATKVCAGTSVTLTASGSSSLTYCSPTYTTTQASGDYIGNVTFAGINNTTGDASNDYTYYSSQTAAVTAGTGYPISLLTGSTSSIDAQQFGVWIDYNQNGTFEASEFAFSTTTSTYAPTTATGTITVPTTAYNGITRMRIVSRYSTAITSGQSCSIPSDYGEAEDYNVTITGGITNPNNVTYVWSNGSTTVGTTQSITVSPSTTTNYTVTVTNSGNCSATSAPTTVTIASPLTGVYSVGSGSIAGEAGHYSTLTAAVADYNGLCLGGAVTFALTSTTYGAGETFPIVINANSNASSTNTLTIKPASGVAATISGSSTSSIIKLNGADYVTIDGSNSGGTDKSLTITNTSTASSTAAIWLSSLGAGAGATNNVIKNTNISTGTTSSATLGIALEGTNLSTTGTGADNDNNTIQNNAITTASVGIYAVGTSANVNDNLVVSGNTISYTSGSLASVGIEVSQGLGGNISGNTVSASTSVSGTPVGISVETGFTSATVSKNIIAGITTSSTSGYGSRGITIGTGTATSAITVSNNFVYGVNGSNYSSFGSSSSMGIGVGVLGSSLTTITGGVNLYYNSVSMTGSMGSGSTTAITTALYVGSASSALDIRDNIFSNTQTATSTTQKNYAVYSAAASTAYTNINYNDYYFSNSFNAASAVLGYLSSDRATLAVWQTATGKDVNSVNINPLFTSNTNLHINLGNGALDNLGTPITGITTDIDNDTRSTTTPDIGADEFIATACSGTSGGTIVYSGSVICTSGSATITASGYPIGTSVTYQWEYSNDNFVSDIHNLTGQTNAASASTGTITTTTYYRLRSTCTATSTIWYSNIVTVTVTSPALTGTTPATRCGVGTVVLQATAANGADINWYTSSTGGIPVGSGTSFTTPVISSTTTYYAAANSGGSTYNLGEIGTTGTDGSNSATGIYLVFNASVPFTLNSVVIYPYGSGAAGTVTIALQNSSGTTLQSATVAISSTTTGTNPAPFVANLGFAVPTGSNYRLTLTAFSGGVTGLYRDYSGTYAYPYAVSGVASITTSSLGTGYYYHFYNWTISTGCESARTAVTATVTTAPTVSVNPASAAVCAGSNITLTASSTNSSYTYTWTPGNAIGATQVFAPTVTTTYTVTAKDNTSGANSGCVATASAVITADPAPTAVSITPSNAAICAGTIQPLTANGGTYTATEFTESFNGTIPAWTKTNTSTGGVPANSDWTLRPNGYDYSAFYYDYDYDEYFYQEDQFRNSDSSQFYLSNADAQGSAGITHTTATSPVINTTGYQSLSLKFTQNFLPYSSADSAMVQVSTDGVNFTTVAKYTTLQGGRTYVTYYYDGNGYEHDVYKHIFASSTVDLSSYINKPNLYIRFKQDAVYGFWWAIDNVTLSGVHGANITWSPVTGLYTNASATTAYTAGTLATTVYAKPGATTVYTATAKNDINCTSTATATVTVNLLPDASISTSHSICAGDGSGVVISSVSGGTVYYHTSTNAAEQTIGVIANGGALLTDVPAVTTTYTLDSVKSAAGCITFLSAASTVTVNPLPTASVSGSTTICKNGSATITFSGTAGATVRYTVNGGAPQSIVLNGSGTATLSTGQLTATTTYALVDVTNTTTTCSQSVSGSAIITVSPFITWTGLGGNANWNTDANWCSGSVPLSTESVIIPSGTPYDPKLLSGDVTINGLTIDAGATVDLNSNNFTTGAISGGGMIIGSLPSTMTTTATGTVNFDNANNTIHNLIVSAGTLTLGSALNIEAGTSAKPSIVTIANGAQLNTGDNLTLKSDVDGTAAIGPNTSGNAYITGKVTVERYTDAEKTPGTPRRAWRFITAPVAGQSIFDGWQEGGNLATTFGTLITGEKLDPAQAASEGFDYIGGGNHTSIKQYDSANNAWVPLSTNSTIGTQIPIRSHQAYMLFVRGNRSVSTGASTANVRAKGTLLQGDQAVAIGTGPYTAVGNPYASTIDFGSLHAHNTGAIQDKFYLWNSHLNSFGAYVLVDHNGTNGYEATPAPFATSPKQDDDAYKYIPSGSGFFVSPAANPSSTTLTISEGDKAAGSKPPVNAFRVVAATNVRQLLVNLNQKNSDTSADLADGFRVKFSGDYEGNEDDNSSIKVANFNENLGLTRGGSDLIVEARGNVKETDTLFMKMWYVTKRSYQLQMKADNFTSAPGVQAWLVDSYLGTKQELSLSGSITTVDFAVNSDSLSSKSDRFMIVFRNNAVVLPVTLTSVKASPANGGVNVNWTVTNEVNIKQYTIEKSADGGNTYTAMGTQAAKNNSGTALTGYNGFDAAPKVGDNLYRIRIEAKDGTTNYSQAVKVTIGESGTGIEITLYPNPVREGKVNLQMTNLKAGTYLAGVYSEGGQTVYQKKITISQSNTTQSEELRLGKALAQGSYQVRIADHNGAIVKETQLIVGR